jgi:hypothetical protein
MFGVAGEPMTVIEGGDPDKAERGEVGVAPTDNALVVHFYSGDTYTDA